MLSVLYQTCDANDGADVHRMCPLAVDICSHLSARIEYKGRERERQKGVIGTMKLA